MSESAAPPQKTPATSPEGEPTRTRASYVVGLAGGTFGVYLALLTPVLVSMAFKMTRITDTQAEATVTLGLVMGIGSFFAVIANPLVGRLSDRTTSRFGRRRPWIVGGALAALAAFALIGAATEVWMVFIGWSVVQVALNGVLAALFGTVPDQVPVDGRGKVSGLIGLMTPLGILGGSVLVSVLNDDFSRFVVPGAIAAILLIGFAVVLRDRQHTGPVERYDWKEFLGSFVFNPVKYRDFGWTWLTKFLIMFGYAGVATFLPFYLTDRFDLAEDAAIQIVLLSNIVSFGAMAISGPLGGAISDRIGRRRPFVTIAGLVIVVGLVVVAFAPAPMIVVVGQGIIGLGAGSFLSVDLALATQVLPDEKDAAKDLGVLNIAAALPGSIAPLIAPVVIAAGAGTALGGYALFYLAGAVVTLAGAILVYQIKGVR
ncbi:MFS transporter [Demequina sp. NBRC 110055]|uniref:MFS transporter n=1 Tax=Demequina sp. NBRC 110055 TaxID=1570344 RepID=UPI000A022B66|nr:MFS transporter [Demequina sp. NBRC 110055]